MHNPGLLDESTNAFPFALSTEWFLDESLTLLGGTFDPVENQFTPSSNAIDSTRFYFSVSNSSCASSFTDTLFVDFENPIGPSCGNITWNGGTGSWFNTAKWDKSRLPSVCDNVVIENALDSVILNNPNAVQLGKLENHGNILITSQSELQILNSSSSGITNFNQIQNLGSIHISSAGLNGYTGFDGSNFNNLGDIEILDSGIHGIWMKNAMFENNTQGQILVENSAGDGIRLVQVSQFIQKGILTNN